MLAGKLPNSRRLEFRTPRGIGKSTISEPRVASGELWGSFLLETVPIEEGAAGAAAAIQAI